MLLSPHSTMKACIPVSIPLASSGKISSAVHGSLKDVWTPVYPKCSFYFTSRTRCPPRKAFVSTPAAWRPGASQGMGGLWPHSCQPSFPTCQKINVQELKPHGKFYKNNAKVSILFYVATVPDKGALLYLVSQCLAAQSPQNCSFLSACINAPVSQTDRLLHEGAVENWVLKAA